MAKAPLIVKYNLIKEFLILNPAVVFNRFTSNPHLFSSGCFQCLPIKFGQNVMDGEDWAEGTQFLPGSSAINEALHEDKAGIGYYGVGYVDGVKALDIAHDADSGYYSPLEAENVNEGHYPLARPLYFYTNGVPGGQVKEFLDFVLSTEGQQLIEEAGFYQLTPEMLETNERVFEEIY